MIKATLGRSILQPDRDFYPGGAVNWMRLAIKRPRGRKLRVVIYARISTDEQRQQSLAAQIFFCRQALSDLGLTEAQVDVRVLQDDGISGEIVSRPGIDEVNRLIRQKKVDLLIVEDASRLYRIENACFQLVEQAIECGARVVCIRDRVDSVEEGTWGTRLHEAMIQHGRANEYTRYRINRTFEELWCSGAAVGKRKPGHLRTPSILATADEPARGPWYDQLDPVWVPVGIEAYRLAAAGEIGGVIARYLASAGLPRQGKKLRTDWDARAVLVFLRDPINRGHEIFRATHSRRPWSGGKSKVAKTDPEKVWTREMPQLRIVSDHLWYGANDAIDRRCLRKHSKRGIESSLYGIPRDSRSPVAGLLVCHCGKKLHAADSRRYRCSQSLHSVPREERCWNAASADCDLTHRAIAKAIRQHAEQFTSGLGEGLLAIQMLLADGSANESAAQKLEDKIKALEAGATNLTEIGEKAQNSIDSVVTRLETIQEQLDRARAELEDLNERQSELELPTPSELLCALDQLCSELERGDRQAKERLKFIVPTITAVPFQQFPNSLVVLKARFAVNLLGLLPAAVRLAIQSRDDEFRHRLPLCFQPAMLEAELFERSTGPKYCAAVMAYEGQSIGLAEIGRQLGIKKHHVWVARTYGRRLHAAGLTDPYTELKEPPASASRWRPNGRNKTA